VTGPGAAGTDGTDRTWTGVVGRVPADLLDAVDEVFRERVAAGVAPSSVWGVFDADGLVASGGHGDRGDGRAPDADTVYRIASCTKSVTAAALLLLVERGLVDLEAPITDFVPAFRQVRLPTADSPVPTLRMLLTMSAGFPTDDPWADRQESISDAALDDVLRDGLLFDSTPGTRFAYSNLGYALLGRVVGLVSGVGYRAFATTEVLEAVGLPSPSFTASDTTGFVVRGARPHDGGWEALPLSGPGAFSSIGGLFSTVGDLARWATHLSGAFRPGGTASPATPVTTAHRRLMQQAQRSIPGRSPRPIGYGFGLFVEEDPVVGSIASHSGGYPGFSAHMRWSTGTGLGVVAFENATAARVPVAATAAHDLLLAGMPVPVAADRVLPATRAAKAAVTRLLADWRDDLADATFTANVDQDVPRDRRRAAIATALVASGASPTEAPVSEWSDAPTHLGWRVPGTAADLVVELRLAPLAVGLVQSLVVRVASPETDARG
jgi:CubicO group peptidase (beta-lactamase class C family)